jgi:LacI family transcriptional regulator
MPAAKTPSRASKRKPAEVALKVALLIETSNSYARGLLEGITAYLRENRRWSVYLAEHGRGDRVPQWLNGWDGDGIIARVENASIEKAVVASGLPVVDVSAARLIPNVPWVETDDRVIAEVAAAHLMNRGFRHFAFSGVGRFNWSAWRGDHFRRIVTAAGYACETHESEGHATGAHPLPAADGAGDNDWESQILELAAWVKRLPRPVGVFACFDVRGFQVLEACRRVGLKVPDEVAVLGVDNDALLCDLADPPMSSVIPDTRRTGYEAAALLDRMIAGMPVPSDAVLIPPLGVATRRSTDVFATDDPDLLAAMHFLRENAFRGITVKDLTNEIPVSRRLLEARFKQWLGRSPHEELARLRVERVKELLAETDLPLKAIAQRIGIRHVEYVSVMFRRATGQTTTEYRRRTRQLLSAADAAVRPLAEGFVVSGAAGQLPDVVARKRVR